MIIEAMVTQRRLDRVTPSPPHAQRLLEDAERHIASATAIADQDPTGSYQLAYDAGRKSASAILSSEGLRSTAKGGHVAVIEAMHELGGDAFSVLDRMRRRRHRLEYPSQSDAGATPSDAREVIGSATEMLTAARAHIEP